MIFRVSAVAFLLLALSGQSLAVAEDDERWIDQYVKRRAAGGEVSAAGKVVGFAELQRHVGQPVRVLLVDGRERRGRVQQADSEQVILQALVAGGSFSFGIEAAQVRRVQLETSR
jgi:hypothetical protein